VPSGDPSPQARRREAVRRLLDEFDPGAIDRRAAGEPAAARALQSFLFDEEELVRWRAVEAMGRAAAVRARSGLEPARQILRRTLWLMNDESGGLLWHGPQVLAAVMANVPALCDEFGPILGSFLEEEPFREGTRWAFWRLAPSRPEMVLAVVEELEASLGDASPAVRGHAALALRAARGGAVTALAGDGEPFDVFDYRTGSLRRLTVSQAAGGEA
jgi:HEAT repeat protein